MVAILSQPYNQVVNKHVESTLVPRLDEGSIPSSSTELFTIACNSTILQAILFCAIQNYIQNNKQTPKTYKSKKARTRCRAVRMSVQLEYTSQMWCKDSYFYNHDKGTMTSSSHESFTVISNGV